MSSRYILVGLVVAASLSAGCGKKEAAPGAGASATPAAAAPAAPAGPVVLELTANDTMKYDVTRLEVKAGDTVRLVLHNAGALPKAAMGHNVIILKAGANLDEFVAAALAAGPAKDYFPADRADQTIAHTKLVGPKEKAEVTFKAPAEPGEYTYFCSFPGHIAAGMKGVLVVK